MASPAERSGRQVSRAIDALRRGQPVGIRAGKAAVTVLAVEIAEDDTLSALDAAAPADGLITAYPAATLKLVDQRVGGSLCGTGCVGTYKARGPPYHIKNKKNNR